MPNSTKLIALSLCLSLQLGFAANQVWAQSEDSKEETSSEETKKDETAKTETAPEKDDRDGMSGIIYGTDHAYNVTAPKGWVLDTQAGVQQGVHAVFYPVGTTWADAKAVMYSRIYDKKGRTFDEVIADDLKHQATDAPDFKAEDKEDIDCTKGAKAKIKYLTGDMYNSHEAVAYIDEPKKVIIVVMSSRQKDNFEPTLKPFKDLVKSYFWVTDKVEIHDSKDSTDTTEK